MDWRSTVALALLLAGCSETSRSDASRLTLVVDPSLRPSRDSLPAFEDGQPRPLAAVTGDDGTTAEFVADELWVSTDDASTLDALVARWQGSILKEFHPGDYGLTEMPAQYLVRVVAAGADTGRLADDLRALNPDTGGGEYRVSSQAGLELIAAAGREAARGLPVGLNWVGQGSGAFRDRNATEAPTGSALGGVAYDPNAFRWPSHSVGSTQDIGVAEAWRALDLAGKLGNRVKLAVLDMGFGPDQDWPSGWTAISNVPLVQPTGTENLLGCGGGFECPWHGTEVVSASMALADNGYGGAGSAGPVADPIVVFTLYDFFTSITALGEARLAGARIANMSYGAPVPWYLGWSVLPFEAATYAFRQTGMLLFAAAGNDGKDVDAEGCTFGVCWERTWYTPCENAGVICVGGLRADSKSRASGSNYGNEQVDIFAPYTLWLGPDPGAPGNQARVLNGTSFSSPFAAGVAALIWAADPGLGADAVENQLMSQAHSSPDGQVRRYVNALGAVSDTLGNIPPGIDINTPTNGSVLPLNVALSFDAQVEDFEDGPGCCTVTWTSDVDGLLGTGNSIEHTFATLGPRTVTVTARDSKDAVTAAGVTFTIVNDPPTVTINRPLPGETIYRNAPIVLRASSFDFNEPGGRLACDRLVWTSSLPGDAFPASGCEVLAVFGSDGARTLTLTGTDPQGASATANVGISVVEPPPDLPPVVQVTSPADHSSPTYNEPVTLTGTAVDPEGAAPLTYEWTVKLGTLDPIVVGHDLSVSWTPSDTYSFSSEGLYSVEVRLTATDPTGNVGSDFVVLEWLVIL
ncbi:MAG: S8 family serine peptidase [Deltaproteobacteria bacterium]|nr:S8 family serine peptidase [Deltaproteobacteria bacterium]